MKPNVYEASPIKRQRSTRTQIEERREALFNIIAAMKPMTVRQVFHSEREILTHLVDRLGDMA